MTTWTAEKPVFMCPGGQLVFECDGCGGTTWEQRSDRRAVRCTSCGGVEILPDPASVLAESARSTPTEESPLTEEPR